MKLRSNTAMKTSTSAPSSSTSGNATSGVQKHSHCDLKELIKLVEQKGSQILEREDVEEFRRFKNSLKSLVEPYFLVIDKDYLEDEDPQSRPCNDDALFFHGLNVVRNIFERRQTEVQKKDQEIQALRKIANLQSSKPTTMPTTNEGGNVVPPRQPVNDLGAVEQMPGYSGSAVPAVDGSGDASRGPQPGPSHSLNSNGDDKGESDMLPPVLCHVCGQRFAFPNHLGLHLKQSHKIGKRRSRGKWTKRGKVAGSRIDKQKKN